jgi:hypothetical protein
MTTIDDKTPEELGVRLFEHTLAGFDPLSASAAELREHGRPARPDPQLQPARYARWLRIVSGTFIQPKFATLPATVRTTLAKEQVVGSPFPPPPYQATSLNWSGSVVFAPPDDPLAFVSGEWTVPHIVTPHGGEKPAEIPGGALAIAYGCATWIGIDGDRSDDVLQAGTTQLIVTTTAFGVTKTTVTTWAWWEWYPKLPVPIPNLPVSPGDVVYCEIEAISPTEAAFYLSNMTTGISTSFIKDAIGTTELVGSSAEWILEKTAAVKVKVDIAEGLVSLDETVLLQLNLPRFGSVFFDSDGGARTQSGARLLPGNGELIAMHDAQHHIVTTPYALGDTAIRIDYGPPPPPENEP